MQGHIIKEVNVQRGKNEVEAQMCNVGFNEKEKRMEQQV